MNADERTPGQQGYGQQTGQTSQQPLDEQQKQQPTSQDQPEIVGDGFATGQAAYGNSGEIDLQDQQAAPSQQGAAGGSGLFSGSSQDLGNASSEPMGIAEAQADQDFAGDGQGAQDDASMASNRDGADQERSQQGEQPSDNR